MSKNLTRKGLAFGALVALGSSVIAGSPASAAGLYVAGYVNVAPTLGTATQLNTLQAKPFDLSASFAGAAATGGTLKFLVTDADSVIKADVDVNGTTADVNALAYLGGTTTDLTVSAGVATVTATTAAHGLVAGDTVSIAGVTGTDAAKFNGLRIVTGVDTTAGTFTFATTGLMANVDSADAALAVTFSKTAETGNATRDEIVAADLGSRSILGTTASIKARATDGSFVVRTADDSAAGVDNVLRLVSTAAADTSATATVTAWIDNNGNDVINDGEYVSEVKTVKFLKNAEVTFTTELDAPVLGTTGLVAYVTASPDINLEQLGSANGITVAFTKNGSAIAGVTAANANYDSVSKKLKAVETADVAFTAGTFKAQASYDSAERGSAVYQTPEAATTAVSSVSTPAAANSASVAGSAVLTGTKVVTISSTVKKWTTTAAPAAEAAVGAGVKAKVTVTKSVLATASTITAGGKTLSASGSSISFETTTNSDGKVVFDLTSNNGTKTDSVVVKVEALDNDTNDTGVAAANGPEGWTSSSNLTLTWQDASVASLVEVGTVGFVSAAASERNVAKGGSLVLNYELRNNFGALVTFTGYRVALTLTGATAGASATVGTPAISGGKVSFTLVDQTVGATGSYSVLATLEKLNTAGTQYDAQAQTDTVKVNVGTSAASAITVPADATTGVAVEDDEFVTQDLRLDANSKTFTTVGYSGGFTVSGVVSDSTGAPVPGAPVVISAADVAFAAANTVDDNASTLTVGSITVYTTATGAYSVKAYSHKAGDVFITAASGSVSKAVKAKFTYPTTANKDSLLTITGSANSLPGRTNTYVVALTDKRGNPIKGAIDIKVDHSGAGYLANYPTAVSAVDGKANLVLITGVNDSGTATITVTYDVANTDTDVVATKVVTIGAAPATATAAVAGSTGKVYASVSNAAGKTVVVKINGVTKKTFAGTLAKKTVVVYSTAGAKNVSVFVGGSRVATKVVTIK